MWYATTPRIRTMYRTTWYNNTVATPPTTSPKMIESTHICNEVRSLSIVWPTDQHLLGQDEWNKIRSSECPYFDWFCTSTTSRMIPYVCAAVVHSLLCLNDTDMMIIIIIINPLSLLRPAITWWTWLERRRQWLWKTWTRETWHGARFLITPVTELV